VEQLLEEVVVLLVLAENMAGVPNQDISPDGPVWRCWLLEEVDREGRVAASLMASPCWAAVVSWGPQVNAIR